MKKTSEMPTKPRSEILVIAALCICIVITSLGLSNQSAEAALSTASSAATQVGTLPAASLLNSDGTLNLRTGMSGAVDLAGWRVSLDPLRGPVFAPDAVTAGLWSSLGNGVNSIVNAIAVSGSDVYVGGQFKQVCGNAACDSGNLTVNNVAQWNGSAWSALGSGVNNPVGALAVSGSDVYVGGYFTQVCSNATCDSGNVTVNHIAQWNGSAWAALGSGLDNYVDALAVSGSDVYAGGDFVRICGYLCLIGNNPVNFVAQWNGSNWSALGNGVNSPVLALAVSGSDVYVGGFITQVCGDYLCNVGNTPMNYVAHWDGSAWSALGDGVNNGVYALAVSGSDVYVGGVFTQVCGNMTCDDGNATVNHVAHWNGSTWSALGNGLDYVVYALSVIGGDVYGAGSFTQVCGNAACNRGNVTVNGITKWSSATSAWSALGNGLNYAPLTLAVRGSDVYAGGGFTEICGNATCDSGNSPVKYVAKYRSLPVLNMFLPLIIQ